MTRRSKTPGVEPSEHQIQVSVFHWLRAVHPRVIAYAVPNAARRSMAQAAWLKAEGMRAGIPDIVIAAPRGGFHGFYLELKTRTGKLSDSQRGMLLDLASEGYACGLARSVDDAIELINTYLEGNWNELLNTPTRH